MAGRTRVGAHEASSRLPAAAGTQPINHSQESSQRPDLPNPLTIGGKANTERMDRHSLIPVLAGSNGRIGGARSEVRQTLPVDLPRMRLSSGLGIILLAAMFLAAGCRAPRHAPATRPPADVGLRTPTPGEPTIRVLLAERFSTLEIRGERRGSLLAVEAAGSEVRLVRLEGPKREPLEQATGFRLLPAGSCLTVGSRCYPGVVDVFINPLGIPVAVNELALETYLQSVVPLELGPRRFPEKEALKAQAVAARTFAVNELGRNAPRGFDVFRDSRSQEYAGMESMHPLSNQAVLDTRGKVAVYQNRPIAAFYSSTCGGRTEAFHLIFKGNPIPYLKGGAECSDSTSRFHRWEEMVDLKQRTADLGKYAGVGRLKALKPLAQGTSGRTVEMEFAGEKGVKVLKGNDIRFALGLRSNWIDNWEEHRDREGFLESLKVRGRGWGHGVGLCQIGAVEMARSGYDFETILKHYYAGVQLKERYGAP